MHLPDIFFHECAVGSHEYADLALYSPFAVGSPEYVHLPNMPI